MREEVVLTKKRLVLSADVDDIIRRKVSPIGNGAHVICPKEYTGRTVYLVVCKK